MTGWAIFGAVILALLLIGQIRLGGGAEYSEEGLVVRLRVGPVWLQLFPKKKEKRKKRDKAVKKAEKKKKKKKEEPPKKKGPGPLRLLKTFLPIVTDTLGRLRRKIRIDRLDLDFIAGGEDAAKTAMTFGRTNAAMGMLLPILDNTFEIKERRVRTGVDFTREENYLYLSAAFSITIGQLLAILLRFGTRALRAYIKLKEK